MAKDYAAVYEKLKLMHYLEDTVCEYYKMSAYDKIASEKTFQYYLKKNIIGNNPCDSLDILRFLEVYIQKDIPNDWKSFAEKVHNANAKSLLEITEKYGFPSKERIEKYVGLYDLKRMNVIFAIRENRYQDEMHKMFKKEHKIGNISDGEYNAFLALGGKGLLSNQEIEKLNKKGKVNLVLDRQ